MGIVRRRKSSRISWIWKHSLMFSCTFYLGRNFIYEIACMNRKSFLANYGKECNLRNFSSTDDSHYMVSNFLEMLSILCALDQWSFWNSRILCYSVNFLFVCVCVLAYVCMYICTYVCMYVCVCTHVCVCMLCICVYTYKRLYMCININTHVCMFCTNFPLEQQSEEDLTFLLDLAATDTNLLVRWGVLTLYSKSVLYECDYKIVCLKSC